MSDNRVELKFFHRFSRKSNNGKAFGWLKDNLGSACDDAITNVIRFVYLPIALASEGANRIEVETSVKQAREFLNEKIMAALGDCCIVESNMKAPSNVEIKFFHRFSRKSDNGKAFGWLKDNFGSVCDDAITNVVRFVYLPIALASEGANRIEVETSVKQAREFLNEKMMAALGACCEQIDSTKNGQGSYLTDQPRGTEDSPLSNFAPKPRLGEREESGSVPSNGATPVPLKSAHPSGVVLARKKNFNTSNGASASKIGAIDLDDDFLELDEDKFMEG